MSCLPKKVAFVLIVCLGLCLAIAACGSQKPEKPLQGVRILTNQVGYEASGPKKAVIQAHAGDTFTSFAVKSWPEGETVLEGAPRHDGPVRKWKDWDFWTVDWSAIDK